MKKGTGELLERLRKVPDLSAYIKEASDDMIEPVPLSDYLNQMLEKRGLEKRQVICDSGLDRKYGYEIFGGGKRPSRDKVLALCFGMKLTCDEVQELLKRTEYLPLYPKYERDSIILFGFCQNLSLRDVNDLLNEMNQTIIDDKSTK